MVILIIFLLGAFSIIVIDIYLAYTKGLASTLSWAIYTASLKYPAIPMFFGLIVGMLLAHFFWNQATAGCP